MQTQICATILNINWNKNTQIFEIQYPAVLYFLCLCVIKNVGLRGCQVLVLIKLKLSLARNGRTQTDSGGRKNTNTTMEKNCYTNKLC